MTYINNSNKNNKDNFNNESISGRNMSKQKCDDLYIKTSYNYNQPKTQLFSINKNAQISFKVDSSSKFLSSTSIIELSNLSFLILSK